MRDRFRTAELLAIYAAVVGTGASLVGGHVTWALLFVVVGYLAHVSRLLGDLRTQVALLRIGELLDRRGERTDHEGVDD